MIVDAYSHVCPERLLNAIDERHPGAEALALRGNTYLFDSERRLRHMDRIGVDEQVLVLVRPPMRQGMQRPVIHQLTRVANESIAEMAAKWPDRIIRWTRSAPCARPTPTGCSGATSTASCGSDSRPAADRTPRPAADPAPESGEQAGRP